MRATTLFKLQCNNVALQVAAICCSYYFTLSSAHERAAFELSLIYIYIYTGFGFLLKQLELY